VRSISITGATGFIGRRVVKALDGRDVRRVVCLTRGSPPAALEAAPCQLVTGDLRNPGSYLDMLAGCDTVVHLAAATGRATASDFAAVNVEGTRALVTASEQAGVRDFLFISTIAVRYPDTRRYPYAESKARAEAAVRDSRLRFTIVRPTIVVARDAPIWQRLVKLATPGVVLMPGRGTARVQPIHVDDMVAALVGMLRDDSFDRATVELGGADVATFEDLLRGIHRRRSGRDPVVVHLPLVPMTAMLYWLERLIGPALPVTAGQLSAFGNDSVVDPRAARVQTAARGIEQIIQECAGG
jgi:NADH dehydrogenase